MLTKAILVGIPDEGLLDAQVVLPSPLRDLIKGYNAIALMDDGLPAITEKTTGKELKEYIATVKAEQQVKLLYAYAEAVKDLKLPTTYAEDPAVVEQRQMRLLLGKIFVALMSIVALILAGGIVAAAASAGVFRDFASTKFYTTSRDIVHYLFSSGAAKP